MSSLSEKKTCDEISQKHDTEINPLDDSLNRMNDKKNGHDEKKNTTEDKNDEDNNKEEDNNKQDDEDESEKESEDESEEESKEMWSDDEQQKRNEVSHIQYSERYSDDINTYMYRHVILPHSIYLKMARGRLMSENECRELGIQQSKGWEHYSLFEKNPKILLFRRPIDKQ